MASAPAVPGRRRPRWKSALFFVSAAVLSFGLADLLAALVLIARFGSLPSMEEISSRGHDLFPPQSAAQVYVDGAIHPYLGYVHPPLSTPRTTMALERLRVGFSEANEVTVTEATFSTAAQPQASRWGYLDSKPPLRRRSPEKLIVGILGGSVAESFSVEGAARLAEQLRTIDRFKDREIEFVRLAVQGFKQPQQLLTVTWLLSLGAEFDVLINIDGFNELFIAIVQNYGRGVVPSYPMQWDARLAPIGANIDHLTIGRLAYARQRRAAAADFFVQFPQRNWNLAKCAWLFWNDRLSREQADTLRFFAAPNAAGRTESKTGPFEKFAAEEELYRHCVDVWVRASRQLHQLCEQHGIVYYHFLQPNQYVAESKPMSMEERDRAITPDSPFDRVIRRGYPLLEEAGAALESEGLRFHSLAGVFREHEEPLYKDNCCHVNAAGSEVMSDEVARYIGQHP